MDYLRVFFLTLFLVIMSAWVFVMLPVLTNMVKGAAPSRRLASVELASNASLNRYFAAPVVRLSK
jgi:hypothetical protein